MLIRLSDPVGKKKLNQKARGLSELLSVWHHRQCLSVCVDVHHLSEGSVVTCVGCDCGTEMSPSSYITLSCSIEFIFQASLLPRILWQGLWVFLGLMSEGI